MTLALRVALYLVFSLSLVAQSADADELSWQASGKGGAVADRAAAFVEPGGLRLQTEIDDSVRDELSARGHRVATAKAPIAHPVMVYLDPTTGTMHAAGDPAAKRHAAAIK